MAPTPHPSPSERRMDIASQRPAELALADTPVPARALRRATARQLVLSAGGVGVIGDLVLRASERGINLAAYLALVVITTGVTLIAHRGSLPKPTAKLLAIALLFICLLGVRDSSPLTVWNVLAVAVAISCAFAAADGFRHVGMVRVRDLIAAAWDSARGAVIGGFLFLRYDARDALSISSTRLYVTRLVLRGLALAGVVAAGFAMLLAVGDPVFASTLAVPLHWDPEPTIEHLVMIGVLGWPILGLQWSATIGHDLAADRPQRVTSDTWWPQLSKLDVLFILSALNALFAIFVLVQLRVLFGGTAYVLATTGLTMAEYARSGFFTLMAASALVLVTLLVLNATVRDASINSWKASRRLSLSLLVFVGVVLASAATRMALYVGAFGASIERFYAFGAMLWLAGVMVLFASTVLRNRPRYFAIGTLTSAWVSLLAFNVVNTEAIVTRMNLQRVAPGVSFDARYALSLGADAIPALVNGLVAVPVAAMATLDLNSETSACHVARALLADWGPASARSLAGWNLSVWRARRTVAANELALRQRACVAPASSAPRQQ